MTKSAQINIYPASGFFLAKEVESNPQDKNDITIAPDPSLLPVVEVVAVHREYGESDISEGDHLYVKGLPYGRVPGGYFFISLNDILGSVIK